MAILVDKSTRVVVQGITGKEGAFHAARCKEYGTLVVGGVTPRKGGTTHDGFPVWNTVAEAVAREGANCALILVPPPTRSWRPPRRRFPSSSASRKAFPSAIWSGPSTMSPGPRAG